MKIRYHKKKKYLEELTKLREAGENLTYRKKYVGIYLTNYGTPIITVKKEILGKIK